MKNQLVFNFAKALYESSCGDDLKDFPEKVRNKYYITGDRNDFEKLYFRRRDFLSACAILSLNDEKYVEQLEKIIIAICDEHCWALPAHTPGAESLDKQALDLFVAETGFALAEIITVFGDKLSDETRSRVKAEIEKRLLENYKNQSFWWESCNMNWASVCGGFTGGTLIYLFPDEFEKYKDRILNTMKCYIDGFSDEGICPEGAEYWLYGFSAFTYFADLLYRHTNSKTDLFDKEKVKKIAGFMETQLLTGNTTVSFSDANVNVKADLCLQHYLSRKIPENVHLLPESRMSIWGGNTKWQCLYRTLLWVDDRKTDKENLNSHYNENQIIINKDNYSLAIKGGNNDEPHNHNDLGSFIFADKDGQALCDLGAGRYTKDYFNDKRYTVFCNSSLSHNVPIINGKEQVNGKEYFATFHFTEGKITVDLTNAYKNLEAFKRGFEIKDNSVELTDIIESENKVQVIERFVTLRQPEIKGNTVVLGSTSIAFDENKVSLEISENLHIPHEYDTPPITVYCLDFKTKNISNEITFEIKTE